MENNVNDRHVVESSLKSRLETLTKFTMEACEHDDPKLYQRALIVLHSIEEALWKFYMEVRKI